MICILLNGFRRELVRLNRLTVLFVHHWLSVLVLVVISAAAALHKHTIRKAADFVSLQRVVFNLSIIIFHIDHFIATIFDGVVLLVVIVWHHVLEILVRISVHIHFFLLLRMLLELYVDSLVFF